MENEREKRENEKRENENSPVLSSCALRVAQFPQVRDIKRRW